MAAAFGGPADFPCPVGLPIRGESRRLGDWLARLTHWLRIPRRQGCGCGERQSALNRSQAWIFAAVAAVGVFAQWYA